MALPRHTESDTGDEGSDTSHSSSCNVMELSGKDGERNGGYSNLGYNAVSEDEAIPLISKATVTPRTGSSSRFFEPYRSIGIITSGKGFTLQRGLEQNFLAVPIGDRFQILNCEHLAPVIVSAQTPVASGKNLRKLKSGKVQISQVVSDMQARVALASNDNFATLFKRMIHPAQTVCVSKFPIRHMIKIGEGKQVAAVNEIVRESPDDYDSNDEHQVGTRSYSSMLVAIVCSPESRLIDGSNVENNIPIDNLDELGSDDDSSCGSSSDSSSHDVTEKNENDDMESNINHDHANESGTKGEVVILNVRHHVEILRRIPLPFAATVALHPDAYLNKIIVGGPSGQLALINVNSAKIIHLFKCTLPKSIQSKRCTSNLTIQPKEDKVVDNDWEHDIMVLSQSPALDTVAVGTSGGMVHLINLKYDSLLFTLEHCPAKMSGKFKKKESQNHLGLEQPQRRQAMSITSLTFRTDSFASAANIAPLAVGRSDGTIFIWDLNTSEEYPNRRILHVIDDFHIGGVADCLFLPLEPVLVTSGKQDNCIAMHIFDAPDHSSRVLRSRIGHSSPPTFVRYLHPAIGSVVGDNKSDGTNPEFAAILSGGSVDRTLRHFSTVRSVFDHELSQGSGLAKKAKQLGLEKRDLLLPPLIRFATCEARSRDWGDIVTIHRNHAHAYVWSSRTKSQSGPVLRQDGWNVSLMKKQPPTSCHAASVAISACGHFCLVGTKGGTIYKYNLQSGIPRGSYPTTITQEIESDTTRDQIPGSINRAMMVLGKSMEVTGTSNMEQKERTELQTAKAEASRQARDKLARHKSAVIGLAVDSLNKAVLSVGSDGSFLVWNFKTHSPHKKSPVQLSAVGASSFCYIKESELAAVALNDFSIFVVDCSELNVVRRLGTGSFSSDSVPNGHFGPISDMSFGPDGRRLYSSSLDGTIRVWDIPTGSCLDWLSFDSPPTSLTASPTGEFLVTTHADSVGLSMWCDKSFYQQIFVDGSPPTKPYKMDTPNPMIEAVGDLDEEKHALLSNAQADLVSSRQDLEVINGISNKKSHAVVIPKLDGLITMSNLPVGHWKTLFHLELVKERNKPKEAPQKPPSAPFFLQWRQGEKISEGLDPNSTNNNTTDSRGAPDKIREEDKWDAAWSDDEILDEEENNQDTVVQVSSHKKRKAYQRSQLAARLHECDRQHQSFECITEFMGEMGPSAIDIALSELCHGLHDTEGLELLVLASRWLLESCKSRQRFEAVNAYLNRFLYLHANTIAGIELSSTRGKQNSEPQQRSRNFANQQLLSVVESLRAVQKEASDELRGKMQHTLCLLGHFSSMVLS